LLRTALGSQTYAYENTALRDAARPLTTVRDARVLLDTLDTLVASSGAEAHALDLDPVRLALQEEQQFPLIALEPLSRMSLTWSVRDGAGILP
jgi:CHAD domain-containing protein